MGQTEDASIAHARSAIQHGRISVAESAARALLALDPDHVDALEILFLCQQARQDAAGAEATLRHVIALVPARHWPRGDLARLLLAAKRVAEAEAVLADAIAADPAHADAHAMLGALLSERETLVPGARHLQRAIELAGRHPQLLANLGRNLMRQGKLDQAEPLLRDACAASPEMLAPALHLAELAEQNDDFGLATHLLDRAEILARAQGTDILAQRAHLLARTPRWRDALALLDGIATLSGTPLLLRGRLRDRAERYDEAWRDAVEAKHQLAHQRGHAYRRKPVEQLFAELQAASVPLRELPPAPVRTDVPQPIFILGFPRSGTTMTEQVLASHSRIRAGGELPFVAALADHAGTLLGAPFPIGLAALALADRPAFAASLRDFHLSQAQTHRLLDAGADFFTDKMPLNEVYLPLLRLAFPQSPLIAVSRDPRDVLVSVMQHDMTHGFHCGYRLEDAAHQLAAVAALTQAYRADGIACHALRYESFVADQAGETEKLMTAIGLPVEPAQRAFHESRRHAPTPSYAQVREPLHARAIGRWRNYADQLAPVMDLLAPAIARAAR